MHACVQARIFQEMGDTFGERGDLEDLHKAIDSYDAALKIVGDTVPEAAGILLKKGMLLKQSERFHNFLLLALARHLLV